MITFLFKKMITCESKLFCFNERKKYTKVLSGPGS